MSEFERAAIHMKKATSLPSNEDLLELYKYYKQATVGDVNIDQPSFYQLEAKAKYGAWASLKGQSKEEAEKHYIQIVKKHMPDFN